MRESRYNTWVADGDTHVVHNGLSGTLARLRGDERAAVELFLTDAEADPTQHQDLLEALVRARILVADGADELAELRGRFRAGLHDATTLRLTIVTSLGCNFACPYCFEAKEPARLRPEVADAIVERVVSVVGLRTLSVTWFGGEPLLAQPQLHALSDRLIEHCDRRGITYGASIVTNGWHLDATAAEELQRRRVKRAQVTLDGPALIHDRRRPHTTGAPTFDRIVTNLCAAVDHLDVNVRVNIDQDNLDVATELLGALSAAGLGGRLNVSAARLLPEASNPDSPLGSYRGCGVPKAEFAAFELEFQAAARRLGFRSGSLPRPIATPCAAVSDNDLVIGASGELWKCWDDVGNTTKAFGTIFDERADDPNRLAFVSYDPFEDEQCRSCVALPGCMGGCAHLAAHGSHRDDQCSTFRFNRRAAIEQELRRSLPRSGATEHPRTEQPRTEPVRTSGATTPFGLPRTSVPVVLGPRRTPARSLAPT